ncbi:MAG: hypothetical protein U1F67_07445 [Rubrivivax sp.]
MLLLEPRRGGQQQDHCDAAPEVEAPLAVERQQGAEHERGSDQHGCERPRRRAAGTGRSAGIERRAPSASRTRACTMPSMPSFERSGTLTTRSPRAPPVSPACSTRSVFLRAAPSLALVSSAARSSCARSKRGFSSRFSARRLVGRHGGGAQLAAGDDAHFAQRAVLALPQRQPRRRRRFVGTGQRRGHRVGQQHRGALALAGGEVAGDARVQPAAGGQHDGQRRREAERQRRGDARGDLPQPVHRCAAG